MTNGTTPTENGAADVAMFAATIPNNSNGSTSEHAAADVTAEPELPKPPSFDDLGLHADVKQALDDMGYFAPTPVQKAVFQPVTDGKDLLVQSKTGTGKTTAFCLPLVNRLVPASRTPQALILAPTRELALQVARECALLGKHRGIVVEAVYGGAPIGKQITNLRNGVHIVVGTPGRVLDHIGRRTLDLKTISTFVLDECDEMLSMGFLEDIEKITSFLPERHQTLLFSATMPVEVERYSRRHMKTAEQLSLSRDSVSVSDIHHAYYIVSGIARSRDLLKVIFAEEPESAIIFCNMRDETTMVAKFLQKQGLDAEPLSSDLSQADRERVMGRMKAKNLRFLCATDVAARGIDISNLSHVINFSVPESPEVYVHRTGRTGRAGKKGTALSLVGPRELGNFRYVRLTFGIKPEERVLPKDDIFVGKLKVPLPPVGTPTPPDPVQILIRGVPAVGTGPSDLERQIFEKLLTTASGKRVLAQLVAEKLNTLTTRNSPRPRRERPEREDGVEAGGEERGERGDRPFGDRDRGDRPFGDRDRPRRFDRERGDRDERPRRFGEDRGGPGGDRDERPRRFGEDRGERGERDRGGDRDRGGERGERDRGGERRFDRDRGERRFDRDRDRGGERGERGDRGERRDRHEHRGERHEHSEAAPAAVTEATAPVQAVEATTEAAPATEVRAERHEHREHRGDRDRHGRDRDRDRDRGDRGDRRDRHDRHDRHEAAPAEQPAVTEAPAAEAPRAATPAVEDVARAAIERADRGDRDRDRGGKRRGAKSAPTEETREFWETWAETKSTRPAEPTPPPAPAAAPVEAASTEATSEERPARGERSRDRDRGRRGRDRDRGDRGGDDKHARADRPEKSDKPEHRGEPRGKRDTVQTPAPVGDGTQARLFVSLGKKHGVSAEDLRTLLAGPIGGDTSRIGSVSLRDSHAHVRVPEELVETIIGAVHGTSHNAHSVTVERSRA